MILAAVGSMFPFDRLIRAVDEVADRLGPREEFFAQIGNGQYEPRHMPFARFVTMEEFSKLMARSEMVISHAGVGTITETLKFGKPLLVMPRKQRLGEHVNDHQIGTAERFRALGHVMTADCGDDIESAIPKLRVFVPRPRVSDPQALARQIALALSRFDQSPTRN